MRHRRYGHKWCRRGVDRAGGAGCRSYSRLLTLPVVGHPLRLVGGRLVSVVVLVAANLGLLLDVRLEKN